MLEITHIKTAVITLIANGAAWNTPCVLQVAQGGNGVLFLK